MRIYTLLIALMVLCVVSVATAADFGGFAVEDSREQHALKNIRERYQNGEYEKVIAFFEVFQRDYPRSPNMPEAKFYLGMSLQKLDEDKEALDIFMDIYQASDDTAELPDQIFEAIGISYLRIGDYPNAEKWLMQALEKSTDQASVESALGSLFISTGELDKAESHLKSAVAQNKGLMDAHYNLGYIYFTHKGDYSRAKEHFLSAMKSPDNSNLVDIYRYMGLIGILEKDYYSASINFNLMIKIVPNNADYYVLYATALEGQKKYHEALGEADKALEIESGHKGALALIKRVKSKM